MPSTSARPPESQRPDASLYVVVSEVGVVRLDKVGAEKVWGTTDEIRDIQVGPDGALWVSSWDGTVRIVNGNLEKLGEESYEKLAIRSATDVWAFTSSHGHVAHYDGKKWVKVRDREDFKGFYSDNKLLDIAIRDDAVWVAMWNGLWRHQHGKWERIASPLGPKSNEFTDNIFAAGNRLVARYSDGICVLEDARWRTIRWPDAYALWDVSDAGLAVGATPVDNRLAIGPVDESETPVVSDAIPAGLINDVSVDTTGRIWVATDYALTVMSQRGRVVDHRDPGTLPGISGEIVRLVVDGPGPISLPPPRTARVRDVVGQVLVQKSRSPLAHTLIELCPQPSEKTGCAGAPFVRRAKTDAKGWFRFTGIPDGEFRLHVKQPVRHPDCDGLFREAHLTSVNPAKQCGPVAKGSGECRVPASEVCVAFEHPPPVP